MRPAGRSSIRFLHFAHFSLLSWIVLFAIFSFSGCQENSKEPPKKTYTLTVTRGEGVDGYPNPGTYTYDPGMEVNYGYRALEDYSDLVVTLDGEPIAATGTFVMNAKHTLVATCFKRVLWKYDVDSAVYYSSPAIGDDGTVYFGTGMSMSRPGTLYAVGPDKVLQWSYSIASAFYSPAIGVDGTIYIQDYRNNVYAFAPGGTLKWIYNDYQYFYPHDVGQRSPAIGADGTVYIAADGLYAVDPLTGRRIWHYAHPDYADRECLASPVIGSDGTIYVTIGEDMLFAVDSDGRRRWIFRFAHDWEMSFTSPAIDQNGVIYLASEGNYGGTALSNLYAVNPDGTQKWRHPVDGGRFVRASPAVGIDGVIYIATKANGLDLPAKLIALAPNGQKIWDYTVEGVHQTPDDVYSSPSIGADGLIYFGAETGFIYAVNPNGTMNWKFQLQHAVNWSSPAIANDGTIYLGTLRGGNYQGYLYAIKSTSMGYMPSAWPRFRHDRKNTGRFGAW
ncbi:MAG: PQQ-binding-like beta-propeller repeat protein [Candidatus Aminicenantes bacterium]|nr:PQQ-binding-like beta-propeller repeat protein [Candidatus Aminicenantes bacterium]